MLDPDDFEPMHDQLVSEYYTMSARAVERCNKKYDKLRDKSVSSIVVAFCAMCIAEERCRK